MVAQPFREAVEADNNTIRFLTAIGLTSTGLTGSYKEIPMRWQGGRESENIEDRRGVPPVRVAAVGGGVGTVLFVVVALLLGADPKDVLRLVQNNPNVAAPQPAPRGRRERELTTRARNSSPSSWARPRTSGPTCSSRWARTTGSPRWFSSTAGQYRGLRLRQFRGRAVLLPGRRQGLPRPWLLR